MVNGIPNIKGYHEGVCKGYALGKNTRKPFTSSDTNSKEILDLIHSSMCGPMSNKYLGGHIYYVTFIDDHSRKTWLYLLKTKVKVFEKFKEFRSEVETLTERKIKTLRSDNGGEYTSKELIAYCKESSIKRELIVPYNPEQNGMGERKNRTIEECIQTMIFDQDLPKFLWGEAAMTTVYIQNKSPHRILDNMTPEEAFTGKNPCVYHLKVFGCPAYINGKKKN